MGWSNRGPFIECCGEQNALQLNNFFNCYGSSSDGESCIQRKADYTVTFETAGNSYPTDCGVVLQLDFERGKKILNLNLPGGFKKGQTREFFIQGGYVGTFADSSARVSFETSNLNCLPILANAITVTIRCTDGTPCTQTKKWEPINKLIDSGYPALELTEYVVLK